MRFMVVAALYGLVGLALAPIGWAQEIEEEEEEEGEEPPEPPTVEIPDVTEQARPLAGIGGDQAYAEAGTAEFGGSLSLSASPQVTSFSAEPMIGYFPWNNIEGSLILGVNHFNVDGATSNRFSFLVEPSVHIPFTDTIFGMAGLGSGLALATDPVTEAALDAGFALAPRLGVQFLVGRSGLLNLGARYAAVFSDLETDVEQFQGTGQAVLAFRNTFDVQAGYTVMF